MSEKYDSEINVVVDTIPDTMGTGKEYYIKVEANDGINNAVKESVYKIYNDAPPVVNSFTLKETSFDETTKHIKFDLTFDVKDPFDKYYVCVSDSDSTCSSYSQAYTDGYTIDGIYVKDKNGAILQETIKDFDIKFSGSYAQSTPVMLYLHVKDSHGNKTVKGTVYDACYVIGADGSATGKYGTTVNTYSHNKNDSDVAITANNCAGNCYYISDEKVSYEDENGNVVIGDKTELDSVSDEDARTWLKELSKKNADIYGTYTLTSTSYSEKVTNKICLKKKNTNVSLNCSFYNCFKVNKVMSKNVIGVYRHARSKSTTEKIDGKTYKCTGYYKGYSSSKASNGKDADLTENGNKYCAEAVEESGGPYAYDSSDSNPYIRGDDYSKPTKK